MEGGVGRGGRRWGKEGGLEWRFEGGFGQVQGSLEKWEGRGRWGRGEGGGGRGGVQGGMEKWEGGEGGEEGKGQGCQVQVQSSSSGSWSWWDCEGRRGCWRGFQMDDSWWRRERWWEGRWGRERGVKRFFGGGGGSLELITSRKRGGGGGEGGPLSPRSYSHNKTSIIRDRSSMGKRISTLIQSSFNMNEGHITREPVNKGFQTQVKREKKGVLWGGNCFEDPL